MLKILKCQRWCYENECLLETSNCHRWLYLQAHGDFWGHMQLIKCDKMGFLWTKWPLVTTTQSQNDLKISTMTINYQLLKFLSYIRNSAGPYNECNMFYKCNAISWRACILNRKERKALRNGKGKEVRKT